MAPRGTIWGEVKDGRPIHPEDIPAHIAGLFEAGVDWACSTELPLTYILHLVCQGWDSIPIQGVWYVDKTGEEWEMRLCRDSHGQGEFLRPWHDKVFEMGYYLRYGR